MRKHNKKRHHPQPVSQSLQWIIKILLFLVILQVAKEQNPHDVIALLHVLLQ
jgi:hypothetical protein